MVHVFKLLTILQTSINFQFIHNFMIIIISHQLLKQCISIWIYSIFRYVLFEEGNNILNKLHRIGAGSFYIDFITTIFIIFYLIESGNNHIGMITVFHKIGKQST